MPKFYTAYETRGTRPSPAGTGFEPTFEFQLNKRGVKELVETGKTNLYEKIQSSVKQCEVYSILERFDNGDISVLHKGQGQYGDFTKLPTTLAERQQQLINCENMFYKLPLDVRREFGGSFTRFLASFEDGTYKEIFSKFGHEVKEQQSAVNPEVVNSGTAQPNFNPLQNGGVVSE